MVLNLAAEHLEKFRGLIRNGWMQWRGDQWPVRVMGALFGLGALAIGALILVEPGQTALTTDAAHFDFAAISIITGLIALLGSLLMPNVRDLWYCNPERSKKIGKEAGETLGKMIFGSRRTR